MIRKYAKIITVLVLSCLLFLSQMSFIAFGEDESNNPYNGYRLATYMNNLYPNPVNAEMHNKAMNFFKVFEQNKESDRFINVYSGTEDECFILKEYFNDYYTFDNDIRLEMMNNNGYYTVYFNNTLNADAKIDHTIQVAEKAKAIAATLGGSPDQVVMNVYNWIVSNVRYDIATWNSGQATPSSSYYGAYEGIPVQCGGFAQAFNQLCVFNGVNANCHVGYYQGYWHTWNSVYLNGATKYVDCSHGLVGDGLWPGYSSVVTIKF